MVRKTKTKKKAPGHLLIAGRAKFLPEPPEVRFQLIFSPEYN
jgi:hypothetical protein